MADLGPMSLGALRTTVGLILRELSLGYRCWSQATPYTDYISGMLYIPHPKNEDVIIVTRHFTRLADRYKWNHPTVTMDAKQNLIYVTMRMGESVDTTTAKRMPI